MKEFENKLFKIKLDRIKKVNIMFASLMKK